MKYNETASRWISTGVMLCILSPVLLVLLGGLAEAGFIQMEVTLAEAGDFFFFIDMEPFVSPLTFMGVAFAGGGGNGRFCAGQYVMNCSAIQRRGYNNSNILLFGVKTPAIRR